MMTPARKEPDQTTYSGRFAVRLRSLREKAKLSPEQVSEALSVSLAAIYHWESGRSRPDVEYYPILAKLYKISSPRTLLPEK